MPGETGMGAGRWIRLLLLIIVGLLIAIGVAAVLRGRDWAAAEHRRNYRELEIVGRAIEGWPKTIESMARANFSRNRITKPTMKSQDDGAKGVAGFVHPEIGAFQINYSLRDCPATAASCAPVREARVDEAESRLAVSGDVPLRDLAATEQDATGNPVSTQELVDDILDSAGIGEVPVTNQSLLHFSTKLSLERIANLGDSAPHFETALVVDNSGRVVARLGGKPLPVTSIEDIVASDGDLGALFLTSARVIASNGTASVTPQSGDAKLSLRANAEPVSVKIAGDDYIVYVRPLDFPAPWISNCLAGTGDVKASQCKLVGLARQSDVYARSVSLSPDLLLLAAIFLTLAVALVPVMKMRFLGPAGHLSPLEVIAAIFGIVASFALAVLAAMLLVSSLLAHAQSRARLDAATSAMAEQFESELRYILRQPIRMAMLEKKPETSAGRTGSARLLNVVCPQNGNPALENPAPEFVWLAKTGDAGPWLWPLRETVALTNGKGFALAGTVSYSNRCVTGTRFELGDRAYFKAAMAGASNGPFKLDKASLQSLAASGIALGDIYALGAVRSQSDANDKLLVAVPYAPIERASTAGSATNTAKRDRGVLFESMTLRSFLAPVLPGTTEFMVIDADDPRWPYVFGSNARRIGIDTLKGAFGNENAAEAVADAVRAAKGNGGDSNKRFDAVFEGKEQQFVARGLKGTPWVLLLHQPLREVDVPIAATASFAAAAWAGLALIAGLGFGLAWAVWRKASWLWLWPRPTLGHRAVRAAKWIALVLAAATVVILIPMSDGLSVFKASLAVLVPIGASVIAWRNIGRAPSARPGSVLMPSDEHGYRWLYVTLFLSFGALPMLVMWNDAARVTHARSVNAEIVHLEAAWKANRAATRSILKSINLIELPALLPGAKVDPRLVMTKAPADWPEALTHVGAPGLAANAKPTTPTTVVSVSDWLHAWAGMGQPPVVAGCTNVDAAQRPEPRFCVGAGGSIGLVRTDVRLRESLPDVSRPGIIAGLLAMCVLLLLLRMSTHAMVRALFGFGTPLEAVTYPTLSRSGGKLELPERVVILNGPLALQLELLGVQDALDLGQTEAQRAPATGGFAFHRDRLAKGETVVAIGLEVALRDSALCEAALVALEELSLVIDRKRRADGVALGRLVVLTDLSPLDRILQAYEREQNAHSSEQPQISRQQQLRWSRLFEDFTTIIFRPTPKFLWNARVEARCRTQLLRGTGDVRGAENAAEGIVQLVREAHYLPEAVLNSLIDPRHVPSAATWAKLFVTTYPISMTQYGRLYWRPVWAWAQSVAPATHQAATDYLRGTLIEHYQHLWVASSRAERVILDNLARGRVVSIEAALALRSLIRRGLVVLDPEPRLINASFGAFVRQAERPEAMADWRKQQGKSSWDKAALPLAILLPGAILLLAGLALMAGESFTTVFPVILGVGPALLATFGGGRKQS